METYDADAVNAVEELARLCLLCDEILQAFRTVFFHALKAEFDIDRQLSSCLDLHIGQSAEHLSYAGRAAYMRFKDVNPAEERALIVSAAAAVVAVVLFVVGQHKGIRVLCMKL